MKEGLEVPTMLVQRSVPVHARVRRLRSRVLPAAWALLRTLLLVGIAFILLYPVIYMVSISLRSSAEVMDPSVIWIPKRVILSNFPMVLKTMRYPQPLLNTLSIGVVSALLSTAACCLIGYGFARFRFRERGLLFALVLFTILVPPQTLTIPMYLAYRTFDFFGILRLVGMVLGGPRSVNILDTRIVFYLPALFGMGIRSGLCIYIYRQVFRNLPKELEDSALIDGCGGFGTFLRIMVPNATTVIVTVFLFSAVWYWNDYFHAVMYLGSKPTVATALASLRQDLKMTGVNIYDPFELVTRLQTGSLVSILPLLVVYVVAQRWFTESIDRTGIVG